MARAKKLSVPRPPCPDGHKGGVLLRGTYRSKRTGFERPRYSCVPDDPSIARHKFTPDFSPRRPIHDHSDVPNYECATCETVHERGQWARALRAG